MTEQACGPGSFASLAELTAPTRNRYFYGKLLDALNCTLEQSYFIRQRALLSRLGLGAGVLVGLPVEMSADRKLLRVGPGAATDDVGRTIVVTEWSPSVDPRQPTDACGRPAGDRIEGAGQVTLCLAYYECAVEPVPVLVADCDTERGCAPGAIRERYRLQVISGLPAVRPGHITEAQCGAIFPDAPPAGFDRRLAACETLAGPYAVPTDECIVLATIELAADGTIAAVDTCTYRPVVYSNAVLFDLIMCLAARVDACCGAIAPTPPAPTTPAPTTPEPTTPAPSTPAPVTPEPVTPEPATPPPTTTEPLVITPEPGTPEPSTPAPVSPAPVSPAPTSSEPATPEPATPEPTSSEPTSPAPTTPEPTTPAPTTPASTGATTFRVRAVEFRDIGNNLVRVLDDPQSTVVLEASERVGSIRVTFNKPVDHASVVAGDVGADPRTFSFLVQGSPSDLPDRFIPGSVSPASAQITRFTVAGAEPLFRQGEYRVTMFGTPEPEGGRPAISSMNNELLDGEPLGLPSGDGTEGGDFVFRFVVQ